MGRTVSVPRTSPSLTSPQNPVRLAERLGRLERYLGRRGVTLKVGSASLEPGKAGAFRAAPDGTAHLLLKVEPTNERNRCMLSLGRDHSSFAPAAASIKSRSTASSNSLPLRFLYRMIPLWSIT
jgi:hypothetical protein